jgi:hypothetical protein
MTEAVGWVSSLVLLVTIAVQIGKQWSERSVEGVSVWLLIFKARAQPPLPPTERSREAAPS